MGAFLWVSRTLAESTLKSCSVVNRSMADEPHRFAGVTSAVSLYGRFSRLGTGPDDYRTLMCIADGAVDHWGGIRDVQSGNRTRGIRSIQVCQTFPPGFARIIADLAQA